MSLRFVTANIDWAAGNNGAYIAWLCRHADVLLLQEAKDVDLAQLLPPGWRSLQDTSSPDRAGSCIAVRTETVKVHGHGFILGARPLFGRRRFKMLTRWIATADLEERATGGRLDAISCHFPPTRFRLLQPGFEKRLRARIAKAAKVVVGLDGNQSLQRLADRLGLDAYGEGIVGILTDAHVAQDHAIEWGLRNDATDHPAHRARVVMPAPKKEHRHA